MRYFLTIKNSYNCCFFGSYQHFIVLDILKFFLYIYILFNFFTVFSQKKPQDSLPKSIDEYIFVKVGDTLTVELEEFSILPKHKFASQEDARYYYWFSRKVYKAYPYALLASKRLDSLNARLNRIQTKRKKKRYIRQLQKYVEGEFSDDIKKMTRTEGRILIKLIHRQTGITIYNHIKEYKNGWSAFWYNSAASVFKLNLKAEYNPTLINEDYLIEDVLQRAFLEEKLTPQKSKVSFNFQEIAIRKKGKVDVEVYKKMFAKQRKKRKKRQKNK